MSHNLQNPLNRIKPSTMIKARSDKKGKGTPAAKLSSALTATQTYRMSW
jgi:hypothetical protein